MATLNVTVVVATHGDKSWQERAQEASASVQDADETICLHLVEGTLAEVRNAAARSASCDWLCFLDADDELGPGYLDAMRTAYTAWDKTVSDAAEFLGLPWNTLLVPALQFGHRAARIPDWDRLLIDLNCACIGTLVPRHLFEAVDGFREWPIYEDWDLWLRLVRQQGARLLPVPEAVYRARMSSGSRNQQNPAVRASTYAAIRQEYDDVPPGWWRGCKVRP